MILKVAIVLVIIVSECFAMPTQKMVAIVDNQLHRAKIYPIVFVVGTQSFQKRGDRWNDEMSLYPMRPWVRMR